jgi:protein-S-isoprenylcysteine O-methyltransferase Ste14
MSPTSPIPARPPALIARLVFAIVIQLLLLGIMLFLPAGTWHWWRAWWLIGLFLVAAVVTTTNLFPTHGALLEERLGPLFREGQPLADKIVLIPFLAAFFGWLAFIPLDVFRFHLIDPPGTIVSSLGLMLFVWGWWIAHRSLQDNAFASAVVRYQRERQHKVIDTGAYGIVRHPMYAGAVVLMVGIALWLQSYAGALGAAVPLGLLVLRIGVEERFLLRELPGYRAYAAKVRYRLVPYLW